MVSLLIAGVLLTAIGCGGSSAPRSAPTIAGPTSAPPSATTPPPPTTPTPTGSARRKTPTRLTPTATSKTSPPPPVTGSDNRVYVLGDSVLLGTMQTLPAALHGWRVTMDCVGSRRLTQAIGVLRANRSRIGAVVVIQMGNNFIPGEDGTFASQIDQAMRVLTGVHRVVWVTVAEKWSSRVTINRAIRAAASRWTTIRVADWAPIVAAHPSYAYDMLHLTPSGRLAISRLIAGVVGPRTSA